MELSLFLVTAVIWIGIWLLSVGWDKKRIEHYFSERGFVVVQTSLPPISRWGFGNRNGSDYQVMYRDREGKTWQCSCKTSLFNGVFTSEDEVCSLSQYPFKQKSNGHIFEGVKSATDELSDTHNSESRLAELLAENEKLRDEIVRLRHHEQQS